MHDASSRFVGQPNPEHYIDPVTGLLEKLVSSFSPDPREAFPPVLKPSASLVVTSALLVVMDGGSLVVVPRNRAVPAGTR